MTLEIALALLAFAAPVTAAILKLAPERKNGHVTEVEYQSKIQSLDGWIGGLERRLESLEKFQMNKQGD